MVLNNPKPYDSDSSAGADEEPWEMIGEYETETTPLAAAAQIPTAVPDHSDADGEANAIDKREIQQSEVVNAENSDEHDGNLSLASGVSSITGDHHTVSEVDDEESLNLNEGIQEHDNDGNNEELDSLDNAPLAPTTDVDSPEKKDEEKCDAESNPLVEQLSQMGFEKEQIEKAIGDLREVGATEIDADSVIGSMVGENNQQNNAGSAPLSGTWDFVESTVQDLDRRHQLRQRTQNCMRNFNQSAQDFWSNVRNESQQFRSNLRETCDQADVHARNATTSVRFAASSAKDSVCRANEQYRITEKLATVAVVGGATLLALGNPRAGVGAIAVAGATLAAGEAMKQSSAQSTASRDYGLNEDLHLD